MKTLVLTIVMLAAGPAFAWDGPAMWYRAADDANPGGGGILGTGGGHDHGIKCTDCYVERKSEPNLAFAMTSVFISSLPCCRSDRASRRRARTGSSSSRDRWPRTA